ncbi:hypothetical protein C0992_003736 [Termitomyces sp. T32_za158]|nr:hypothetical protein C0992_003736 [Termitomyces sp. T32_za158]
MPSQTLQDINSLAPDFQVLLLKQENTDLKAKTQALQMEIISWKSRYESIHNRYIENTSGVPVSREVLAKVGQKARRIWFALKKKGLALESWGKAGDDVHSYYVGEILNDPEFSFFQLCNNNWKLQRWTSKAYPSWAQNHHRPSSKPLRKKARLEHPILDDDELFKMEDDYLYTDEDSSSCTTPLDTDEREKPPVAERPALTTITSMLIDPLNDDDLYAPANHSTIQTTPGINVFPNQPCANVNVNVVPNSKPTMSMDSSPANANKATITDTFANTSAPRPNNMAAPTNISTSTNTVAAANACAASTAVTSPPGPINVTAITASNACTNTATATNVFMATNVHTKTAVAANTNTSAFVIMAANVRANTATANTATPTNKAAASANSCMSLKITIPQPILISSAPMQKALKKANPKLAIVGTGYTNK